MALWNGGGTWNSGLLWGPSVPPPLIFRNPKQKKNRTMKRQRYFPKLVPARPDWFGNYAAQLALANATLDLTPADVTASVADARYLEYVSGLWLTATREFGPAATAALEELYDDAGPDPFVLPVFTAPALPAGVVAVPPGALQRIFAFVQVIKTSPNYTEAIGLQLGIVGAEETDEHPVPEFTLKTERGDGCECVKVAFRKYGRPGVAIHSRRGAGAWEMLGAALTSPYMDERPLLAPAQPEIREYRLQYYEGDGPTGDFTAVESVKVGP